MARRPIRLPLRPTNSAIGPRRAASRGRRARRQSPRARRRRRDDPLLRALAPDRTSPVSSRRGRDRVRQLGQPEPDEYASSNSARSRTANGSSPDRHQARRCSGDSAEGSRRADLGARRPAQGLSFSPGRARRQTGRTRARRQHAREAAPERPRPCSTARNRGAAGPRGAADRWRRRARPARVRRAGSRARMRGRPRDASRNRRASPRLAALTGAGARRPATAARSASLRRAAGMSAAPGQASGRYRAVATLASSPSRVR